MYGDKFIPSIQIARFLGNPVKPIAKDKKVDPAIIKAIIQEVLVAPNKDKLNVLKSCDCKEYKQLKEIIEGTKKSKY